MRRLVLLLVVVAVAAASGGYALASKDAHQAHGSLRSQPLIEGCTSPIGFCTAGRASGTINGDFVFTAHRSVPSSHAQAWSVHAAASSRRATGELRCPGRGRLRHRRTRVRTQAGCGCRTDHRRHGWLGRDRAHPHARHLHARRGRQQRLRGADLRNKSPARRRSGASGRARRVRCRWSRRCEVGAFPVEIRARCRGHDQRDPWGSPRQRQELPRDPVCGGSDRRPSLAAASSARTLGAGH